MISRDRISVASSALPSRSRPHSASTSAIDLAGVQLADPRVYIASDRKDLQIRTPPQQLGLAPQGSRPDPRTLRQGREARCLRRQKRVARIVARQHTRNRQPVREPSLQIFQFKECTARSIYPAINASSISLTNSPLPPISARSRSCTRSPVVRILRSRPLPLRQVRGERQPNDREQGRSGAAPWGCRGFRSGDGGTALTFSSLPVLLHSSRGSNAPIS